MIDTVIINIPKNHITKLSDERWDMIFRSGSFGKFVKNPTKLQKEDKEKYYPRITGIKRAYQEFVKIEFSVPKLIFLNNLDELENKDFNLVIDTLHERLKEMDVFIEKQRLKVAEVLQFILERI